MNAAVDARELEQRTAARAKAVRERQEQAQVIALNDANIHTLSMIRTAPDFTEMLVDIEVWDLKHRVALPVAQLKVRFGEFNGRWNVVLPSWDGDVLLLLVRFGDDWLFQPDTNGNLVASFHSKALGPTPHQLKQTLVPHTFFLALEGYSVNASPFI